MWFLPVLTDGLNYLQQAHPVGGVGGVGVASLVPTSHGGGAGGKRQVTEPWRGVGT